jgi:hypothetical protein
MSDTDRLYAGMAAAIADANEAQAAYEAGTSTAEKYDTDEPRRRALRQLSGALGRHVTEDQVNWDASLGDTLIMADDSGYLLLPSNVVYVGDGRYMRNGRPMAEVEVERLYAR